MTIVVTLGGATVAVSGLLTSIQAKGYGTDTAASQLIALNSVYRRVLGLRRWSWLETQNTTLVTITGTATVDLTPVIDLKDLDAVRIERGTEYWDLLPLRPQELRAKEHLDRTNGVPAYWSLIAGELHLYPRPDAVYTLTVDYTRYPDDLTTGSPVMPFEYQDVLVWGAISEMAYRERDWAAHQYADRQYADRLSEMITQEAIRNRQQPDEVVHSTTKWADFNTR